MVMKKIAGIMGLVMCMVGFMSCNKYKALEFEADRPESLALQEEIDSVAPLKSFINRGAHPKFLFGAALSLPEYVNKSVKYRLVNRNFDEIVMGYEMKHGAVVQSDGSLALDNVSKLLHVAKESGMAVYGHTLAWHANQNANYLKGLISPLLVTAPGFNNDLNLAGLKDGTFNGWFKANAGAGITLSDNGMGAGTKAIKLVSGNTSAQAADLSLYSPSITVKPGKKYEILCFIKSDKPGEGRITFEGLSNNAPVVDWMKTGKATETFTTGISWKEIRFQVSDFTGSSIKLQLNLGYKPGVTYYVDVNNFYVFDTQGDPVVSNLVVGGDFETGSGWGGWGGSSSRGVTANGLGYGNTGKAFFVTNPTRSNNFWEVQSLYTLPGSLNLNETYELSFWVKGTNTGIIRPELQSPNFSSNGFGMVNVTTDWTLVTAATTVTAADRSRLIFSYGEYQGTVYIDNVVLKSTKAAGGTTIAEKTALEKEIIISGALEDWIRGMVTVSKGHVKAWDVVNEPMDDGRPAELKTAVGRTNIAADEFFWQDYMGKDYAVKAFQWARQYGNPTDIHFINDYNLEFSLDKCRGLINYVNYIESKGAKVDGIGTQMHIDINADKAKIEEMFKLLAATGKLVKISELDIGLGGVRTPNATAAQYQAQAEMYKFVIDKYFQLIPKEQRYGITIWSPLDSPANSSWRAGEPIGLWTENYVRKLAYAYVAKALQENAK